MHHSQKGKALVCGLSTRKIVTPWSIQKRRRSWSSSHSAAPVLGSEVERVDVLVFLGRVFGVLDGAVGARSEPFGCSRDLGVVGRGLKSDVEGHLDVVLRPTCTKAWKSSSVPRSGWMACGRLRRSRLPTGLPGSPALDSVGVVGALAELAPMGWMGGRYSDVEAQSARRRAGALDSREGAVTAGLGRCRAREDSYQAEKRARTGSTTTSSGRSRVVSAERSGYRSTTAASFALRASLIVDRCVRSVRACCRPDGALGGALISPTPICRSTLTSCLVHPLLEVVLPRAERIDPAGDVVLPSTDVGQSHRSAPAVIAERLHLRLLPVLGAGCASAQGGAQFVVAVGEDVCFHDQRVAHDAFDREVPVIDAWRYVLDDDAIGCAACQLSHRQDCTSRRHMALQLRRAAHSNATDPRSPAF